MKRCFFAALVCVLLTLTIPLLFRRSPPRTEETLSRYPEPSIAPSSSPEAEAAPTPVSPDEETVVLLTREGEARELPLSEYLPRVLAGEMPALFDREALRAQAVAARTYVLYHKAQGNSNHGSADVCADPACCQLCPEESELRARWGEKYDEYYDRLRSAVESTAGQYLAYNGEPILACFHASSDGMTESSGEIWGEPLPYLVCVSSPESEETVPNFVTTAEFSPEDFREILFSAYPEADLTALPPDWIGESVRDSSGRVFALCLGGVAVPGVKLRSLFSLRSASFTLSWTGHSFLFTVTGSGHGAGMSQYGANVMAKNGSSYADILAHYYPGTELMNSSARP